MLCLFFNSTSNEIQFVQNLLYFVTMLTHSFIHVDVPKKQAIEDLSLSYNIINVAKLIYNTHKFIYEWVKLIYIFFIYFSNFFFFQTSAAFYLKKKTQVSIDCCHISPIKPTNEPYFLQT